MMYGFGQFYSNSHHPGGFAGWQVHGLGGADSSGNYQVQGQYIVGVYNRDRFERTEEQLALMGLLNRAYHEGDKAKASLVIEQMKGAFTTDAKGSMAACNVYEDWTTG